MEYNGLNQLTKRYEGSWADGSSGEKRWEYAYDANGNLTDATEETYSAGWSESLRWEYEWNPRDQMSKATKYVNTALAGYVEYQYCLSCDGALSKRLQYNSSSQLTSEKRYEYDGLNLLRVDERCDADGDGIVEAGETTWRMVEVATHRPGQLGALVGKRVYSYPTAGNRCVSNGYTNYTYGYDAIGNVVLVYTGGGDEAFFFAQDAFGNELDIATFESTARERNTSPAAFAVEKPNGVDRIGCAIDSASITQTLRIDGDCHRFFGQGRAQRKKRGLSPSIRRLEHASPASRRDGPREQAQARRSLPWQKRRTGMSALRPCPALKMGQRCSPVAYGGAAPGRTGEGAYPTPEAPIFIAFQRVGNPHKRLFC